MTPSSWPPKDVVLLSSALIQFLSVDSVVQLGSATDMPSWPGFFPVQMISSPYPVPAPSANTKTVARITPSPRTQPMRVALRTPTAMFHLLQEIEAITSASKEFTEEGFPACCAGDVGPEIL